MMNVSYQKIIRTTLIMPLLLLLLVLNLTACGQSDTVQPPAAQPSDADSTTQHAETKPLAIAASIYPFYDMARQIAGDTANVTMIVPPGAGGHEFEPKPSDLKTIHDSDLVIISGAGMEQKWINNITESIDPAKTKLFTAADGLELLKKTTGTQQTSSEQTNSASGSSKVAYDPHIWLDPNNMIDVAQRLRDTLIELRPEMQEVYQTNADRYIQDMHAIDEAYKTLAQEAPRKDFVVSNAAFGYLAHRYGLKQIPIAGLSSEAPPSQGELRAIIDDVKARGVPAIAVISLKTNDLAETVAREAGVPTIALHTMGSVRTDQFEQGLTYQALSADNIQAFKKLLGVEQP